MDPLFFRSLSHELPPLLTGGRIGKISMVAEGFWTIELHVPGAWWKYLLVRCDGREGLVFPSAIKPDNPQQAAAQAMWLRKRVGGRFALACLADWPSRRLALELSPGEGRYLILDLAKAPSLTASLDPGFGDEPAWPEPAEALADPLEPSTPKGQTRKPFLSRPVRRALAGLDPAEIQKIWLALRAGGENAWLALAGQPALALACGAPAGTEPGQSPLAAAQEAGQIAFFGALAKLAQAGAAAEAKSQAKRAARRKKRLDEDRDRLENLTLLKAKADAIAANLDSLDPKSKLARIVLEMAGEKNADIDLDPSLTVVGNMERLYRQAAKGKRGLAHLARRETSLENGLPEPAPKPAAIRTKTRPTGKGTEFDARSYLTSDGFRAYRGKNARGNHLLLTKAASPHDYWFHAENGPGAHLILKRDHPGVEIPRRSIEEAAALAALAGWERDAAKAHVICALAKDVRHIKGADMGAVAVDKVLMSLVVDLDPTLEPRLRQS
jgi:predicted ribosome quality control (RQC) complex YloA/Tae2 family protein